MKGFLGIGRPLKCYYAHPMSLYGTPQEKRDIAELEQLGFEVLNPNVPEYKDMPMADYCKLVRKCAVLAFRALPDGSITSGVALEIAAARRACNPIIEIPSQITRRTLTVAETVEYLKEAGQR